MDSKISITQNDLMNLVFGYSFFPNAELIDDLVTKLDENLLDIEYLQNIYARGNEIPEMRHLGILNIMHQGMFSILPTLPYEKKALIFDPAAYGQYLNGTHLKRGNYIFKRRWVSMNHIVGSELKSKELNVNLIKPHTLFTKTERLILQIYIFTPKIFQNFYQKIKKIISSCNFLFFLPSTSTV